MLWLLIRSASAQKRMLLVLIRSACCYGEIRKHIWDSARQTYDKIFWTSEDSDQPAHPRSLIRVFAGHMCLLKPPGYPKRDKWEPLPYWVNCNWRHSKRFSLLLFSKKQGFVHLVDDSGENNALFSPENGKYCIMSSAAFVPDVLWFKK